MGGGGTVPYVSLKGDGEQRAVTHADARVETAGRVSGCELETCQSDRRTQIDGRTPSLPHTR